MAAYRKKPVEIEAWPVREITHAASRDWDALPEPIREAYERGDVLFPVDDDGYPFVRIVTLEGTMDGQREDWIICGVQGELYPCKPDIFEATYDSVDSNQDRDPATCHHVNVTERPRYAIDDEPGHYLCLDCGDKFPLIGDTDKWEPKALDPAREPVVGGDGRTPIIDAVTGQQIHTPPGAK